MFKKIKETLFLGISLAKAQFKLRNEGSYLGLLWYLLEPLCFFWIILFVGGTINQTPIKYYPLYLFLGLIMFNFFINSTSVATQAIVANRGLLRSVKINQEALVIAGVFQFVFSHILEMVIFMGFMIYFHANPVYIIFYPFIFILFIAFVLGISFVMATLGVYICDLPNIWAVFCRLLWFLTPVFYFMPPSQLFQRINYFNPMFHFINISRQIIIYMQFPKASTLILLVFLSCAFLFAGLFIFRKFKNKFAELV